MYIPIETEVKNYVVETSLYNNSSHVRVQPLQRPLLTPTLQFLQARPCRAHLILRSCLVFCLTRGVLAYSLGAIHRLGHRLTIATYSQYYSLFHALLAIAGCAHIFVYIHVAREYNNNTLYSYVPQQRRIEQSKDP